MKKTKTKSFLQTVILFLCTCLFFLTGCASNKIDYIRTEDGRFNSQTLYEIKDYEVYVKNNSEDFILKNIKLIAFKYFSIETSHGSKNIKKTLTASVTNFDEKTINELEIINEYTSLGYIAYSKKYHSTIYVNVNAKQKEEKNVKIQNKDGSYVITYYTPVISPSTGKYNWITNKIEIPKERVYAIYYYSK